MAWLDGDPWLGLQIAGGAPIAIPLAPWLGTQGQRDPYIPGVTALTANKSTVEPSTFFCEWLRWSNTWDPTRTQGRTPIFAHERDRRRVTFQRDDIILCRFDSEDPEPVGLGYHYENDVDTGVFRIYTRVSADQVHFMKEELKRSLQKLRRHPFGSMVGQGSDWLKIVHVTKAERTRRAFFYQEIHVEVPRRWRPIITADTHPTSLNPSP